MLRFRRKAAEVVGSATRRFVVFSVREKDFGVDIGRVSEAIRLGKVVSVPKSPGWLRGVMDLRGKVIPIVDLADRLEISGASSGDASLEKGILVSIGDQTVALAVDDVHEVIELEPDAISVPDRVVSGGVGEWYLEGVGQAPGGLLLLLNVDRLFSPRERNALSTVGEGKRPGT